MKKLLMLKSITAGVALACAVTALAPLGVSAQWKENTDNTWSYIEGSVKVTGWKKVSGKWYYFNTDGTMNTGWVCVNNKWYYNNNSGEMSTGWLLLGGKWYYLNNSGEMQTGSIQINGKWYYFDKNGCWIPDGNGNSNGNNNNLNDKVEDNNTDKDNNSNSNNNTDTENNLNTSKLPALPTTYQTTTEEAAEEKILQLMNKKRTEAGLKPLIMDNTLRDVARYKSNHMIQYNYFNHTSPDGTTWQNWLKTLGYKYSATAENIAYNSSNAEELFNQWWNSEGHKANMMNASYTKVGIGVIYGNNKHMGTQIFSN